MYILVFLEEIMKENLALLLAILYLIYRFKTYKKTNKINRRQNRKCSQTIL